MRACALCLESEANKKGSHMVPHFLLKRIENIEGRTGRDYELGVEIGSFTNISHFGRAVSPEKLENFLGEVTDSDIENNEHPLIVDNVFCASCEARLAVIESEYAKSIKSHGHEVFSSGVDSVVGLLFWASVLWRVSVNGRSGMRLTKNHSEILRRILNRTLTTDVNAMSLEQIFDSKDAGKLSYRLLRCPGYSDEKVTHFLAHPRNRYPYSLLLDEYLVLFTFNGNYNDCLLNGFFGVSDEISEAPVNKLEGKEMIKELRIESMTRMNEAIIDHMKSIRVKELGKFWDKLHRALGGSGRQMPEHMKKEMLKELTSNERKSGRKHTLEDLRNITFRVVSKYTLQT